MREGAPTGGGRNRSTRARPRIRSGNKPATYDLGVIYIEIPGVQNSQQYVPISPGRISRPYYFTGKIKSPALIEAIIYPGVELEERIGRCGLAPVPKRSLEGVKKS